MRVVDVRAQAFVHAPINCCACKRPMAQGESIFLLRGGDVGKFRQLGTGGATVREANLCYACALDRGYRMDKERAP